MNEEKIWFAATGRMALLELVRVIHVRVINLMSRVQNKDPGAQKSRGSHEPQMLKGDFWGRAAAP